MNKYASASKIKESRRCKRKARYATREEADAWRMKKWQERPESSISNSGTSYQCGVCGGWHTSRMVKRKLK